jgi:hypothetical protein
MSELQAQALDYLRHLSILPALQVSFDNRRRDYLQGGLMVNVYLIRKYAAFFLIGFLSVLGFFLGLKFYGFNIGLLGFGIGAILSLFLANALTYNPFTAMLEGSGILMMDLNSTGIIRPFIMAVRPPFVYGRIDNKLKEDIFDREMVFNFAVPQNAGMVQQGEGKDGQIRTAIVLNEEEYNRGRYGFLQYPCILYNSQLNTVLTKDWLSDEEKTGFAEHQVLYLNKKVEQLTDAMLNFGRYIVDQLKPKTSFFGNWLIWVVIVIVVIVLIVMFAPALIPAIKQAGGLAKNSVSAVVPIK